MEIIPSQEVRDVDVDVDTDVDEDTDMDVVPTMLLIFPIHFQHYTYNKIILQLKKNCFQ